MTAKGVEVADNAAPKNPEPSGASSPGQKPTLFIILAVVNMLVVIGVGAMIYMGQKKKEAEPGIDAIVHGEHEALEDEAHKKDFIGQLIPLETFLVNLSGQRGRKLAKVNMEFEVSNEAVMEEIDQLKPKIRDMIIIILSSKTFAQMSTKDGKEILREEIKDQVNLFLTKGQINKVYFTEFIFN
ncbi:MAG: flagellar basal body-associated FliL family protein [Bdellovibrionales bacterium]|nr:flagellar basal body-associated FliL family protein [Bdellovibrionales bacterium]